MFGEVQEENGLGQRDKVKGGSERSRGKGSGENILQGSDLLSQFWVEKGVDKTKLVGILKVGKN